LRRHPPEDLSGLRVNRPSAGRSLVKWHPLRTLETVGSNLWK
jgi:hypothetical protein